MNTTVTEITESNGARLGFGEFVALMAMMTSLAALSTDAMLPALPAIGLDLGLQQENAGQLVVSFLFLGMAVGQLFYGPVSDSSGRKPAIYVGYGLFIVGCLMSIFSSSFVVMLAGRLLQGIGVAGPRSVSTALIRDLYEGRRMAQVMSFIATVFILVPVIAPMLGQGVLMISGWRAIFGALLVLALLSLAWFALRQPETLPTDLRVPFSIGRILRAFRQVLTNPVSLGYTVTAGLASGAFMGYLNSAFHVCFHPERRPGTLVIHGLHDASVLLHRHPLRQPQFAGHGASGPHRRRGCGRGRFAFADHCSLAGRVHRPTIQRHDPAVGWRLRIAGTGVSGHHVVGEAVRREEAKR